MEINYTLNNVEDVAKQILNNVATKTLVLYGSMGVGKTTLVKSILKILGSYDVASSPTFSIVNEYKLEDGLLFHFDLYRIKDLEEAYNFGIEDYLYTDNWCIIEWPEVIEEILPKYFDTIDLELNDDKSRTLRLNIKTNLTKKHAEKTNK